MQENQKSDSQNQKLIGFFDHFLKENNLDTNQSIPMMQKLNENYLSFTKDLKDFQSFICVHVENSEKIQEFDLKVKNLYQQCLSFYSESSKIENEKSQKRDSDEKEEIEEKKEEFFDDKDSSLEENKAISIFDIQVEWQEINKKENLIENLKIYGGIEIPERQLLEQNLEAILNKQPEKICGIDKLETQIQKNYITTFNNSSIKQQISSYLSNDQRTEADLNKIKEEFLNFFNQKNIQEMIQQDIEYEGEEGEKEKKPEKIFEDSKSLILKKEFEISQIKIIKDLSIKNKNKLKSQYEISRLSEMISLKQLCQVYLDKKNNSNLDIETIDSDSTPQTNSDINQTIIFNKLREKIQQFSNLDNQLINQIIQEMKEKGFESMLYKKNIQSNIHVNQQMFEIHQNIPFLNLKTIKVCQLYFQSLNLGELECQNILDQYFYKIPDYQMDETKIQRLKQIEQFIFENVPTKNYIQQILNLSLKQKIQSLRKEQVQIQVDDTFYFQNFINTQSNLEQLIAQQQLDKSHPDFFIIDQIYKSNSLNSLYLKSLLLLEIQKPKDDGKLYFSQIYQFLNDFKNKGIEILNNNNQDVVEILKIKDHFNNAEQLNKLDKYYIELFTYGCSQSDKFQLELIQHILNVLLNDFQLTQEKVSQLSKQIFKTGLKFFYQLDENEYKNNKNEGLAQIEQRLQKNEILKRIYGNDLYKAKDESLQFYVDFENQLELQKKRDQLFQADKKYININKLLEYHNPQEKLTSMSDWYKEIAQLFVEDLGFSERLFDLLIYLAKRKQNLDKIYISIQENIENLKKNNNDKFFVNKKTAVEYLMRSSDDESQYKLTLMLGFANPLPLITTRIDDTHNQLLLVQEFFCHNFWLLNQSDRVIASIGVGFQKGKSDFLNQIFATNFALSDYSYSFMQSVDIESNNIFLQNKREYFIADFHGDASLMNEQYILGFFVYYIIQVSARVFQNKQTEQLEKIINLLESNKKNYCLVIRDFNQKIDIKSYDNKNFAYEKFSNPLIENKNAILIPNIQNLNKNDKKIHINKLRKLINSYIIQNSDQAYSRDLFIERFFKKNNNQFGPKVQESIEKAEKVYLSVQNICNSLQNQISLEQSNIFKLYSIFSKYKRKDMEFNYRKFQFLSKEQVEKRYQKFSKYEYEYQNAQISDTSQIFKEFEKLILEEKNPYICMLLLRNINNQNIKKLKEKKKDIEQSSCILKQSEKQKNILKIENKILNSSFSVELFQREMIQVWEKKNKDSKEKDDKYIQFSASNIYNGFPFEIIDGETFYYPFEFLKECFSCQYFTDKRFCIISIIGPQNSGKSTLLNYFLGCDFYVSEGRCTRGIYGTLVKSKIDQFDYILVIDSEGLLSQEKNDPDFDRRLTLFCLSVSQFLIINVKDQLTPEITKILELCVDISSDLKSNKIPKRIVEIVFNQKADPNKLTDSGAVQEAMKFFESQNKIIDHIEINSQNVTNLPSAFSYKHIEVDEQTKWSFLKTQINFVEGVQKLGDKIIKKVINICQKDEQQFRFVKSIPELLQMMKNIYDTIVENSDLTAYQDILHKQNDKRVKQYIKENIANKEILKEENYSQFTKKDIENFLEDKFSCLEKQINDKVQQEFQFQVQTEILQSNQEYIKKYLESLKNNLSNNIALDKKIKDLEQKIREKKANLLKQAVQLKQFTQEEQKKIFEQKYGDIESEAQKESDIEDIEILYLYVKKNFQMQIDWINQKKLTKEYKFDTDLEDTLKKEKNGFIFFPNQKNIKKNLYQEQNNILIQKKLQNIENIFLKRLEYLKNYLQAPDFIDERSNPDQMNESLKNIYKIKLNQKFYDLRQDSPENIIQFYTLSKYIEMIFKIEDDTSLDNEECRFQQLFQQKKRNTFDIHKYLQTNNNKKQYQDDTNFDNQRLKDVARIVLNNWLRDLKQEDLNSTIFNLKDYLKSINIQIKKEIELAKKVDQNLISKIANSIQEKIYLQNIQLQAYEMQISDIGSNFLKNMAMQELFYFHLQNQKNRIQQMIYKNLNDEEKQSLKIQFLENAIDKEKLMLNELLNSINCFLENNYQKITKKIIINTLDKYKDNLCKENIVQKIQKKFQLENDETQIDSILEYINDPNKVIQDFVSKQAIQIQEGLLNEISQIKQKIIENVAILLGQIYSLIKKQNLQSMHKEPHNFLQDIYKNYIRKDFSENISLSKEAEIKNLFKQFCQFHQQPLFESIEQIKLIYHQLQQSIQKIQDKIKNFTPTENIENEFQNINQYLICNAKCPCCGQVCDQDHWKYPEIQIGKSINKHCANNGHRFAAFNRVWIEKQNLPALIMCSDYDDETQIKFQNTQLRWSKFKEQHNSWDWMIGIQQGTKEKQRMVYQVLWKKVGKQICDEMKIEYHETCSQEIIDLCKKQTNPIHFIIVFDESVSMNGQKWENLTKELLNFVDSRYNFTGQDFCTLIGFDHQAKVYVTLEQLNDLLKSKIPVVNSQGSTCFASALQQVINVLNLQESKLFKKNTVIFFLSDGEASKPDTEIQQLLQFSSLIKLIQFVGFGKNNFKILKSMARDLANLNATFQNVINQEQLKDELSFLSIIIPS